MYIFACHVYIMLLLGCVSVFVGKRAALICKYQLIYAPHLFVTSLEWQEIEQLFTAYNTQATSLHYHIQTNKDTISIKYIVVV